MDLHVVVFPFLLRPAVDVVMFPADSAGAVEAKGEEAEAGGGEQGQPQQQAAGREAVVVAAAAAAAAAVDGDGNQGPLGLDALSHVLPKSLRLYIIIRFLLICKRYACLTYCFVL